MALLQCLREAEASRSVPVIWRESWSKAEVRAVIRYEWARGVSGTEIHNRLVEVRRLWALAAIRTALVAAAVGVTLAKTTDYCRVCQDHTMCRFKGMSQSCKSRMLSRGLRKGDIQLILYLHNQLRSRVALGREFRGNQPPAADMRKLVWDPELATIAQRWVDQCTYSHDACRDLPAFQVGQNLFVIYGSERDINANWSSTVFSWYNEVEIFDASNVKKFRSLGKTSHYTQMVAAATRTLGCGYAAWREGEALPVTSMYACNYGPSGNRFGRPLYLEGRPCSQCPPAHSCVASLGLCQSDCGPSRGG
ncbi:venom allergen 5-like [Schistocerca gregaria]|uniref:venom allergen 5-like n=1 Tax=Schistocerca gregaria TaxID=7010 RepID=UPI00211DFF0C|nr:venom allergen 5-like [Schistocerca gregaria]